MRVAALYDIHGNLPALEAVLADAAREGVDTFVIGGDVAAGPLPGATLDQLIALSPRAQFVQGNMDREIIDAYDQGHTDITTIDDPEKRVAAFAASRISPAHRDFMGAFTPVIALDVDGVGSTVFCHGSPRSDTEMITRLTTDERLREILGGVRQPVVVCGHTHQQFDRTVNDWRVINAGSVGVPYEGKAGAYWAMLGPDVELRRTEYQLDEAIAQLRSDGYPDVDEMLKESLLEPIDPAVVTQLFEDQAAGDR